MQQGTRQEPSLRQEVVSGVDITIVNRDNFSGFVAWFLWRTIYLSKLPRFEKEVRVALDWTLDLMFSKDLGQFMRFRAPTVSHAENDTSPREQVKEVARV